MKNQVIFQKNGASKLNFVKGGDLVTAVIQDANTQLVLMVGFMNQEALEKSINIGKVTFYSRTKKRLWTKGETSGNYLTVQEIIADCDGDSLLVKVNPEGPVCHLNQDTCFGEKNNLSNNSSLDYINTLENVITDRKDNPQANSYTSQLFDEGLNKVAQKVGEEAVELVIESKDDNDLLFKNEAADLLYHYLVLLIYKGFCLADITEVLKSRGE
jgi:phosphoribosyl-AMP cyclohydrolase / phosphoribosyl-ATP pyrophosphohydrolase